MVKCAPNQKEHHNHMKIIVQITVLLGLAATAQGDVFRVTPYVQHPPTNAMSVLWLTDVNHTATIEWWLDGNEAGKHSATVTPRQATELDYFGYSHKKQYLPALVPWQYRHRVVLLSRAIAVIFMLLSLCCCGIFFGYFLVKKNINGFLV